MSQLCITAQPTGEIFLSPAGTCHYVAVSPDELSMITALSTFDGEAFQYGFLGPLSLFAIGTGVGLIINHLRKLRI